jgi:glycosyltransferase involved in cell wall biosynthesis
MTLVSIVIPAFNSKRFVGEAVASVLAQTHDELELIVIDDGSTDDTAAVARAAVGGDSRGRVLSFPNGGLPVARNRGLAEARGEFIAMLDGDDRWAPDKLEKQLRVFAAEPDCVCVGCLMSYIASDGRPLPGFARRIVQTGEDLRYEGQQELIRRALVLPFSPSAIVMRTAAVRAIGGSDETLGHRQGEDVDLVARIAEQGRVSVVTERLADYRLREDSISGKDYRRTRREAWFVVARQRARLAGGDLSWEQYLAEYRPSPLERRVESAAMHYRRAGVRIINRRYGGAALDLALAALVCPSYVLARVQRNLLSRGTSPDAYSRALAPDGRPWYPGEESS